MGRRRHRTSLAATLIAFTCGVVQANEAASQWRALALGRALEATAAITDPYRRAEALAKIARVQADGDDARATDETIENALHAAREVHEVEFRGWVLHDVVLAQIARNDLIGARATAASIEADRSHGAAGAALAGIDVRGGDLIGAQAIATKIRDPESRSLVLRQVIAVMASRGELEPAGNLLRSVDDAFYEAMARGDLAAAEVRAGRVQQAHALAARAPRKHRAEVYGRIALAQVAANDPRGAMETVEKITDARARATVQRRIAPTPAEAGAAEAALDSALHVDDRIARALLVRDIVTLQRDATSASAIASAAKFDDPLVELGALFGVLGAQVLRGDQTASRETIEPARAAVAKIDAALKPAAFAALAAARHRLDGGGEALFTQALNAAVALERPDQRSSAYLSIVNAINDRLVFLGRPAAPVQQ